MFRVVTLAANGLFAASLAILPISAFAQGGTSTAAGHAAATDSKAPAAAVVTTPTAKTAAATPAKPDATKTTDAAKPDASKSGSVMTGKDAAKTEAGKTSMAPATGAGAAKVTTAPTTPKTGG